MTVTSKEQAWIEVNKIFPTDYEKDHTSSERAGYDIYRHHSLSCYNRICDLGDRLEVLAGEYGENVTNIWIVAPQLTVEEQVAEKSHPIVRRQVEEVTFAIMGSDYTDSIENELYNRLGGEDAHAVASDFVVAWCKANGGFGEKWGSVRITGIVHYCHGKSDKDGGHYCITALIEKTAERSDTHEEIQ